MTVDPRLQIDADDRALLVAGEHDDPHAVLGLHGTGGVWVIRARHPDAVGVECDVDGAVTDLVALGDGVFGVVLAERPPHYRLRFVFAEGRTWELADDPYRFPPTIGRADLRRFAEGTHRHLEEMLGARLLEIDGVAGTRFSVWAPHARAVRVVGDFCGHDGRLLPMRALGHSGVWELFVPGIGADARYRWELVTPERLPRLKTDPMARCVEPPPRGEARVVPPSRHRWQDAAWLQRRSVGDPTREPMSIYEVHLGSWRRQHDRLPTLRELAVPLVEHVRRLGFTHLELLPLAEHAYYGSWGYQTTSPWAPTSRYGSADDLRAFVDHCHRHDVGVILDWVPAHFPKDEHALRRFDGRALYEMPDPRAAEHPDWGTLRYDFERSEVRSYLLSNALYWLREFHFDGLRVDAVSWIVYSDYLRGEHWTPSSGGVLLLQELNRAIADELPGVVTVAEEATTWGGVTAPVDSGGLGFTFKWNMGWMNDTLAFFRVDPFVRRDHHDRLTFAMSYEFTERFVNALSHDEVVHLKRSLLAKMPGSRREQLANLRLLLAYQFSRPGKKLLFMGGELATEHEWSHERSLDWSLLDDPDRRPFVAFVEALAALYRATPPLWRRDPDPDGFAWIDGSDREHGVLSYVRRDGDDHRVVVLNVQGRAHPGHRIGVPAAGRYEIELSTDEARFGGASPPGRPLETRDEPVLGWRRSVLVDVPALAALVLKPTAVRDVQEPPPGAVPG